MSRRGTFVVFAFAAIFRHSLTALRTEQVRGAGLTWKSPISSILALFLAMRSSRSTSCVLFMF